MRVRRRHELANITTLGDVNELAITENAHRTERLVGAVAVRARSAVSVRR